MLRRCYVLLWRRCNIPIWRCGDVPLKYVEKYIWDITATLPRRTKRNRYDVATTSCCHVGKHIVMIISVPIMQISKNYCIVPVKYLKKDKLTNADTAIIPNYVTNTNIETIFLQYFGRIN